MPSVVDKVKKELKEKEILREYNFRMPRLVNKRIHSETIERYLKSKAVMYKGKNVLIEYTDTLVSQKDEACKFILRFSWIVNKTASELVEMGDANKEELETLLQDFERWLVEIYDNPTSMAREYLKVSMGKQMSKFVKGFLKANDIELKRSLFHRIWNYSTTTEGSGYCPTKEEIKTFWNHANSRLKLIIQFLTNVPVRRETLLDLKWSDIDLSEVNPIIVIPASRLKGKGRGKYEKNVFASVVSENLKKELIKRKEEEKERFKRLGLTWSEDIHIFLSSDDTPLPDGKFKVNTLSYETLGNEFTKLQKDTGIPISCQSFRYYAETNLQNTFGTTDHPFLCLIGSHKLPSIHGVYGKPHKNKEKLREFYKKVEQHLDLFLETKKKEDLAKTKFLQAMAQGKKPEEALSEALSEYKQFLMQDFSMMEDVLRSEIAKSEKEYKKRYEE